MNTKDYMRSAIQSANALRVQLGRKLVGPHTVSPHVGFTGGTVSVHLSDVQADALADMVRTHKSPARQEWLEEFSFSSSLDEQMVDYPVILHTVSAGCGKWEVSVQGLNHNQVLKLAYEHMEVCGK